MDSRGPLRPPTSSTPRAREPRLVLLNLLAEEIESSLG
jgi:hypothetical protein